MVSQVIGNIVHITIFERDSVVKGCSVDHIGLKQPILVIRLSSAATPIRTHGCIGRSNTDTQSREERRQLFDAYPEPKAAQSWAKCTCTAQALVNKCILPPFPMQ